MNQEKIGRFIAECRKGRKLTQYELAEKLGVTSKSVSRWENGKTMPDYSLLISLCKELDITIIELLIGEKSDDTTDDYKESSKYIEYLEKIINFISFNQRVDIEGCKKVGKILFVGGILVILFALFFLPRSFLGAWLFVPLGSLILLLGFSYMNKGYNYQKRIVLNIVAIVILVLSISMCDLINVAFLNKEPKFSSCGTMGYAECCETLLFDTYRCIDQGNKYHVVYKGYVDVHGDTQDLFLFCN